MDLGLFSYIILSFLGIVFMLSGLAFVIFIGTMVHIMSKGTDE